MIYFDVTKNAAARHHSGMVRVSSRLLQELGADAIPVLWKAGAWVHRDTGAGVALNRLDWLLTPELFSEPERPGFWQFLRSGQCQTAAIFHDAIPLRFPDITWPHSVARQPEYMKMLACFDHVFAVSEASLTDLIEFWKWQEVSPRGVASPLALGADLAGQPRGQGAGPKASGTEEPLFLCLGIVEPRKNQTLLIEAATRLAELGLDFRLEIIGRTNPHFGKPLARSLKAFSRRQPRVRHRERVSDGELLKLWGNSTATLFPTLAEGCGLPLLESLWLGLPCLASDLPVLRENARQGGCVLLPPHDPSAWAAAMARLCREPVHLQSLREEARSRALPTWRGAAESIRSGLGV